MSPDPPGVTARDDPAASPGDGGLRPTFGPEVERVDEATVPPLTARRAMQGRPAEPETRPRRRARLRARKVRRIVRHVEPWSVLKISVLFFLSTFLIISVASTLLWNAARSAGAIDDVESFITSLGFGNCEPIEGAAPSPTTTTPASVPPAEQTPGAVSTTVPVDPEAALPDKDGDCPIGTELVGGFKFEDQRIFQAFVLGGIVLVLAGSATSVVMALLFNLISDLTGGVRVTVLEEEPVPRGRRGSGSPGSGDRD